MKKEFNYDADIRLFCYFILLPADFISLYLVYNQIKLGQSIDKILILFLICCGATIYFLFRKTHKSIIIDTQNQFIQLVNVNKNFEKTKIIPFKAIKKIKLNECRLGGKYSQWQNEITITTEDEVIENIHIWDVGILNILHQYVSVNYGSKANEFLFKSGLGRNYSINSSIKQGIIISYCILIVFFIAILITTKLILHSLGN